MSLVGQSTGGEWRWAGGARKTGVDLESRREQAVEPERNTEPGRDPGSRDGAFARGVGVSSAGGALGGAGSLAED